MAVFTFSVIHLGNVADLDPVDGDADAENQSALLGTYYDANDRAADHITTLTAYDDNNDDLIASNDAALPETVTYDLGSGLVTTQYDALFNTNVTVTFPAASGEPAYNGLGGVIQTETGDLFFVMIDDDAGFGSNSFDDVPIESIQINSISAFGSQSMATASDDQSFVPCFTTGTLLETKRGLMRVEHLRVGDLVETLDNGWQPISWVGRRQMRLRPHMCGAPVQIRAGALGDGYPAQDFCVSQNHRVLLKSRIADRMAGASEVLVPAGKLVGARGIGLVVPPITVHYHHFACAQHQVVWANGTPVETMYFGPEMLKHCARPLADAGSADRTCATPTRARPFLEKAGMLRRLVRRHIRNGKPLLAM